MDSDDLKEFIVEAREMMANAELALLQMELGESFPKSYDIIFRAFHNIKGAAGMMEILPLQNHMHELETIFMGFKQAVSLPKEYISFFLRGIDGARSLLDGDSIQFDYQVVAKQESTPALDAPSPRVVEGTSAFTLGSAEAEFFLECDETIERVSDSLQKIEAGVHTKDTIDGLYRDFHSLKGSAYLFSFQGLGDIAHSVETLLEGVRNQVSPPTPEMVNTVYQSLKNIETEMQRHRIGAPAAVNQESLPTTLRQVATPASMAVSLPSATESPSIDERNFQELESLTHAQLTPVIAKEPTLVNAEKESETSSIRVPVSLLDSLMTLIGEMVLVRNQVLQYSNRSEDLEFNTLSKRLNVVTNEIQDEMMKTRMQAIGNILNKFNRVVRDLSQELHKNISLTLVGSETELDKSLLEAIKDPLTHIVRNSCDHGIESPEIRKNSGKAETGSISIKSYHEGGQVVIEVADDGKGLSKTALLKKGIEKGLITEGAAKTMTEKEIFSLIFAPGFSTAQKVTNVSGRGVGMDVVRTNIEKIGGTVDLTSVESKGTVIKLKIPLTLAIIPALLVKSGSAVFAIPQSRLIELVRVDQANEGNRIEFLHGVPVYRLRGKILPVVDLNRILNHAQSAFDQNTVLNVAVLNADHCAFGLIVDEVQDTADIVVKPLNRLLKSLQIYSGATILGDGSVALILDVLGISKVVQVGREDDQIEKNQIHAEELRKATAENQDYLLVKLNSPTKHALVLGYVHRLEEFRESELEYSGSQRVIRYRDAILPIVSANRELKYGESGDTSPRDTISVIVVERAGVAFGIQVDDILDTLTTPVQAEQSFVKQSGIFGNLNAADELIVVIDPFELIASAFPDKEGVARIHVGGAASTKPLRILLAEDTAFFRKAISSVLEGAGHEVTIASDGLEALGMFAKNSKYFDLIVSDIEMPRLNGFEFAKKIRAGTANQNVPMLAISSRADPTFMSDGMKAGFNVYLEKLKPEILLNAIHELMNTKRKAA